MENLIETFHIDIKLLIAQIINFAIVISVLYFFALKPIMGSMQERAKKIEKSLKDAQTIDKKLADTEEECKKTLVNAKKEANKIMEQAEERGQEKRKNMISEAKQEIGAIINDEKQKMQTEKAKILKEIKSEVANMVVLSLEKVIDKNISKKDDLELIKKTINKL